MALLARKLDTQARACATVANLVLWRTLVCRRPADLELSAYLRAHREYGSRDRHVISATVFSLLRWWGWLQPLAPAEFLAAVAANSPAVSPRPGPVATPSSGMPPDLPPTVWARILLGAHVLEGVSLPPVADVWIRLCRGQTAEWDTAGAPTQLEARLGVLYRLLGEEPPSPLPAISDLLPAWSLSEMHCPLPLGKLIHWLQRRPPVWLRAQGVPRDLLLAELRRAGLVADPHPRLANALRIEPSPVSLYTTEAFRAGQFEVQDLASQVIGLACAPRPGERWWDACAGAGGKTLLLSDLMARRGTVVASDNRAHKLEDLRLRTRRGGFHNVRCREWDGSPVPLDRATFDGVLVDAPCSCSGTWRRNPDARWRWHAEQIGEINDLQFRLLRSAATGVKPGGVLLYATCSLFDRENLGTVRRFLAADPDFALEPFPNPLTGQMCPGTLQVWPWDGDSDAMFVARWRRQAGRARDPDQPEDDAHGSDDPQAEPAGEPLPPGPSAPDPGPL